MKAKYAILILAPCIILSGCVQSVCKVDPEEGKELSTEKRRMYDKIKTDKNRRGR